MGSKVKTLFLRSPMLSCYSATHSLCAREAVVLTPSLLCILVLRMSDLLPFKFILGVLLGQQTWPGAKNRNIVNHCVPRIYICVWSLISGWMNKWMNECIHVLSSHCYWIVMDQDWRSSAFLSPDALSTLVPLPPRSALPTKGFV